MYSILEQVIDISAKFITFYRDTKMSNRYESLPSDVKTLLKVFNLTYIVVVVFLSKAGMYE